MHSIQTCMYANFEVPITNISGVITICKNKKGNSRGISVPINTVNLKCLHAAFSFLACILIFILGR